MTILLIAMLAIAGTLYLKSKDDAGGPEEKMSGVARKKEDGSRTTSPGPTQESPEIPSEYGDLKTHRNEAMGFSFTYPRAWGEPKFTDEQDERKTLHFVADDGQVGLYSISLHATNAKHIDTDNPSLNIINFSVNSGSVLVRYVLWDDALSLNQVVFSNDRQLIYTTTTDDGSAEIIRGLQKIDLGDFEVGIFEYGRGVRVTEKAAIVETLKQVMSSFKKL